MPKIAHSCDTTVKIHFSTVLLGIWSFRSMVSSFQVRSYLERNDRKPFTVLNVLTDGGQDGASLGHRQTVTEICFLPKKILRLEKCHPTGKYPTGVSAGFAHEAFRPDLDLYESLIRLELFRQDT